MIAAGSSDALCFCILFMLIFCRPLCFGSIHCKVGDTCSNSTPVTLTNPKVHIIHPVNDSALFAPFDRMVVRISGVSPDYGPMKLLLFDQGGGERMQVTVSVSEDEDTTDVPILLHGLQIVPEVVTRIALLGPDQSGERMRFVSEDFVRFRVEVRPPPFRPPPRWASTSLRALEL